MNLKKAIKRHGFTLETVAKEMGITKSAMSQLASGNPTYSKLEEIAHILGISVSELVREEDTPTIIICPHCGQEIKLKVT